MTLRAANRAADQFEDRFWAGGSLEELAAAIGTMPPDPMSRVFVAGWAEARQGGTAAAAEQMMEVATVREIAVLSAGLVAMRVVIVLLPAVAITVSACLVALGEAVWIALAVLAGGVVMMSASGALLVLRQAAICRFGSRLQAFAVEFGVILARKAPLPAPQQGGGV